MLQVCMVLMMMVDEEKEEECEVDIIHLNKRIYSTRITRGIKSNMRNLYVCVPSTHLNGIVSEECCFVMCAMSMKCDSERDSISSRICSGFDRSGRLEIEPRGKQTNCKHKLKH